MRRCFIALLVCLLSMPAVRAQNVSARFTDTSMADALTAIAQQSADYRVQFIYDELEDFTITTTIEDQDVPSAIRQLIGFYPIVMSVDGQDIFVECVQQERGMVCGTLVDEHYEPVPFASVVLKSLSDTTSVVATISDLEGSYTLEDIEGGRYELCIQAVGYVEVCDTLMLRATTEERLNVLSEDAQYMQTLVVEGVDVRQRADRRTFTFTKEELSAAFDSFELLNYLPEVQVDPENESVKTSFGGSVLMLVNGAKATNNDVRLIPKGKVKYMEVYDIPPARYHDVATVVNIVTAPLDSGVNGGVQLTQAVSTGFGNNNAFFSWNKGRNMLSLEYVLQYRNYNNRQWDKQYQYTLDGEDRALQYNARDHFGYTDQSPEVKYSFVEDDKTIVEITAEPDYSHYFSTSNGTGTFQRGEASVDDLTLHNDDVTNTWQPSFETYLWKRLTQKDELSFDAVATIFDVKQNGLDKQDNISDGTVIYNDDRKLHNNKYSFIGEVEYSRTVFQSAQWNTGYDVEVAKLHSKVDNEFGNMNYYSRFLTQNAYTELTGTYHNMLYKACLGLTQVDNHADDTKVKDLQFTPLAVLGYTFRHGQRLRFMYKRESMTPNINSLSSNISNVSIDILRTGNPSLKNQVRQSYVLMYNLSSKYVDISGSFAYYYTRRPIIDYFEEDGGKYWQRSVNGTSLKKRGVMVSATVMPLGDRRFRISADLYPYRTTLRAHQLNYSLTSWENNIRVSYDNDFLSASFLCTIPTYQVSGSYRSLTEGITILSAAYKHKDWRLSASLWWIGTPSHYKTITVPGSQVFYSSNTNIYNNRNMVTIGFSYYFQKGKDKSYDKTLSNADTAAPTF